VPTRYAYYRSAGRQDPPRTVWVFVTRYFNNQTIVGAGRDAHLSSLVMSPGVTDIHGMSGVIEFV